MAKPGRNRRLLFAAFGGIAMLLVVFELVAYTKWVEVQADVGTIEVNALASVRLIARMGLDIQRERLLLQRHIFEHEEASMKPVEASMVATRADYAAASIAYGPLATLPGAAARWTRLTTDIAGAQGQITEALALSRANRDFEATQLMVSMEPTFDGIERDFAALSEINQAAANHTGARVLAMERRVLWLDGGLTLALLLVVLGAGLSVTRAISRHEHALSLQTEALERQNGELDAFAGRVAHDLRGPMNAISLATSILDERFPAANATVEIMRRSIGQMTNLVEDLLGLSRLGATSPDAITRTEPVVASITRDLGPMVEASGGSLCLDLEPAAVHCTEGLLRQALWNLGENALKYRRPEVAPTIALVGRARHASYEIRVADNGPGMPEDDARQAFEPFFRGTRTKAVAGTGLGLAIVKRIVEASGGTIALDSALGRGSTFVLTFPLA